MASTALPIYLALGFYGDQSRNTAGIYESLRWFAEGFLRPHSTCLKIWQILDTTATEVPTPLSATLVVLAFDSVKSLVGTLPIGVLAAFYIYATRIFEPISSAMHHYAQPLLSGLNRLRCLQVLAG